jgi:hypothetical protein
LHDEYRFNWPSPLSKVERWEGKRKHATAMLAKWRGRLDALQAKVKPASVSKEGDERGRNLLGRFLAVIQKRS